MAVIIWFFCDFIIFTIVNFKQLTAQTTQIQTFN